MYQLGHRYSKPKLYLLEGMEFEKEELEEEDIWNQTITNQLHVVP